MIHRTRLGCLADRAMLDCVHVSLVRRCPEMRPGFTPGFERVQI
jgi:hypothetical protein